MNIIKLNTIGEMAPIYSEELKEIKASLIWSKDDDLDLMVFYKTKTGVKGAVYSGDIPGGDFGNFDKFPFISWVESGFDEEESVAYEKVCLTDLSQFEEIYFVVTNYSELVLNKKIIFNEYQGILKVSSSSNRYVLKLSSEEKGEILVLGKIEEEKGTFLLKNVIKVMTMQEFREKIPGSNKLTL